MTMPHYDTEPSDIALRQLLAQYTVAPASELLIERMVRDAQKLPAAPRFRLWPPSGELMALAASAFLGFLIGTAPVQKMAVVTTGATSEVSTDTWLNGTTDIQEVWL